MTKRNCYVHGWRGRIQCIYGADDGGDWKYIHPCTFRSAQKIRKNVKKKRKSYRIYKLVDVTK